MEGKGEGNGKRREQGFSEKKGRWERTKTHVASASESSQMIHLIENLDLSASTAVLISC